MRIGGAAWESPCGRSSSFVVDETRFLLHSADFAERFSERSGGSEADNVFGGG